MLNLDITYNDILKVTINLSHRKCVILTLYCAELFPLHGKYSQLCIDLVQKWLDNPKSVTKEQLRDASNAAYAARTAAYAARAVASGNSTYYATWTVEHTVKYKSKTIPYLEALTKKLPKTPFTDPLEIIVYLQDQELYPILDGNRLNLWSPDYDYQITGSIEQIANTIGVRNLLNA